jgi:protoheme IX farnesyltransferase
MIMTAEPAVAATPAKFSDYLELTKPRLSLLSVLTALAGYAAARPEANTTRLILVALGTSLAAGGVDAPRIARFPQVKSPRAPPS